MWSILKKEVNSFFNSLVGYIVIIIFTIAMGLLVWVFPDTNVLDYGFADLNTLFYFAPYIFMFLIPAITMRTIAEEKKTGTLQLLLTRPIGDWEIILGKFFASLLLVIFSLLPTLLYYYTVYKLGSPEGNIDSAGTAGSYIGLIMLGSVFTAIGLFASTITKNQIIAFIVAVFLCFILYIGFTSLAAINESTDFSYFILQLGIDYHYTSIRKGLIDSRDLIYFISVSMIMLLSSKLVLQSRKW